MGLLDVFWHVLNFIAPALGVGLIGSGLTKLLWRRQLRGLRWRSLWPMTVAAGVLALLLGLLLFGRDGRMASYALLVLASAGVLWWRALRRLP